MVKTSLLSILLLTVQVQSKFHLFYNTASDTDKIWFYKQRACQDSDVEKDDGWDLTKTGRTVDIYGVQAIWLNPHSKDTDEHCLQLYPDDDSGVIWEMPYHRIAPLCFDLPIRADGLAWKNVGFKDGPCNLDSDHVLPPPQVHPHRKGYVYKQFSNYDARVPLDVTGLPDSVRSSLPGPTSSAKSEAEETTAISTTVSTVYQPAPTNPNPDPYPPNQYQQYPTQPNNFDPNAYNPAPNNQLGPTSATQADSSQSTASNGEPSDAAADQRRRSWKSRL